MTEKEKMTEEINKKKVYYKMLCMWFWAESHGKSISQYILDCGYKNVAIYGMAEIGELLYYELEKRGINIPYVIDKNPNVLCDCTIVSPYSSIPEADIIIVTPEYYIEEITKVLEEKTTVPIISIQQVICYATGFSM